MKSHCPKCNPKTALQVPKRSLARRQSVSLQKGSCACNSLYAALCEPGCTRCLGSCAATGSGALEGRLGTDVGRWVSVSFPSRLVCAAQPSDGCKKTCHLHGPPSLANSSCTKGKGQSCGRSMPKLLSDRYAADMAFCTCLNVVVPQVWLNPPFYVHNYDHDFRMHVEPFL